MAPAAARRGEAAARCPLFLHWLERSRVEVERDAHVARVAQRDEHTHAARRRALGAARHRESAPRGVRLVKGRAAQGRGAAGEGTGEGSCSGGRVGGGTLRNKS